MSQKNGSRVAWGERGDSVIKSTCWSSKSPSSHSHREAPHHRNSSYKGSNTLFWLSRAPHTHCMDTRSSKPPMHRKLTDQISCFEKKIELWKKLRRKEGGAMLTLLGGRREGRWSLRSTAEKTFQPQEREKNSAMSTNGKIQGKEQILRPDTHKQPSSRTDRLPARWGPNSVTQ